MTALTELAHSSEPETAETEGGTKPKPAKRANKTDKHPLSSLPPLASIHAPPLPTYYLPARDTCTGDTFYNDDDDDNQPTPMSESIHTSGTSTPTRSCLKHSHHHQHTLDAACCSTRRRPGVKPQLVTKTVSFDGHEPQHVYVADYEYDRQSVPIATKLSYEYAFLAFRV